ncbi:MAG: AEC family transporter [Phycisphaerae bacterium]|jgi:hypothetical protein
MLISSKFLVMVALIVASGAGGYACRRLRLAGDRLAEGLMTVVLVFGYTSVGFLSIWTMRLQATDAWLPSLGILHILVVTLIGVIVARLMRLGHEETGIFGIASGASNIGFTMGGFVIYLLLGEAGLGLASIYSQVLAPMTVLLYYPMARHYAAAGSAGPSLGRLMLRNLLDWRSLPLPATIVAVVLSVRAVPRPAIVSQWNLVDVLMFLVTAMAYFAIGLRLHLGHVRRIWRMIAALAVVRFPLAAGAGLLLVAATALTPWPLTGVARDVYLIESFVPTAVTMVGVANMFRLQPAEASVLFVTNTALYLALVLPLVLPLVMRIFG